MTDSQRKKIISMRAQGYGYKAIASELHLSRDTVRFFCKRRGCDGPGKIAALNMAEQYSLGNLCLNCCKPLRHKKKDQKFCCARCRSKWHRDHLDKTRHQQATFHFRCAYCGRQFSAYGNKNRKYCSHDCYIKDRFRK